MVPVHIGPYDGRGGVFHNSPLHPLGPPRNVAATSRDGGEEPLQMLFAGRICGGGETPNATGSWRRHCKAHVNQGYSQVGGPQPGGRGEERRSSCGSKRLSLMASPPRTLTCYCCQGVRQRVHYHHHNRSGFKISQSNPNYVADLNRARFCLAPTGGGHGHRQILVAFAGCGEAGSEVDPPAKLVLDPRQLPPP